MIVDEYNTRLTAIPQSGVPGQDLEFTLRIQCRTGFELSASVELWAKTGTDEFVDINATPIDLTPYHPTTRTFLFEYRIPPGTGDGVIQYNIVVARAA